MRIQGLKLAALCIVMLACPIVSARPLTPSAIDEADLVTLDGNTRPEATAANDRGPVADTLLLNHIQLQLRRPADREAALESYVDGLTNPASANYHRWLSAEAIGLRYGPPAGDVDRVTRWLRGHGFTVDTVYPSRVVIDFTGTAAQIDAAFHTAIHRVAVGGEDHIANIGDPRIPAALAGLVAGPVSLNDIFPRPAGHIAPAFSPTCSIALIGKNCRLVTPADLATIYDFNPVFADGNAGKGQTITVVEDSDIYTQADWSAFRSLFGLAKYTAGSLTLTHPAPPKGGSNCSNPGITGDDFQATLDAEYASAAAPAAKIVVASCASAASWGVNIAIQNVINSAKPPAILSVSYLYCEANAGAAYNVFYRSMFLQAVAEGISVFVSAGDEGSASCDYGKNIASEGAAVNALASTVYAVAVGGTDFGDVLHNESAAYWTTGNGKTYGSAKSYMPEIPWDSSCASDLIAKFVSGSATTFGSSGFCNSNKGTQSFMTTHAGGGGPSTCGIRTAQGACKGYPKPGWQKLVGNPADGVRDLPDVSLFSADVAWGHGYALCISDPAKDFGAPCSVFPGNWIYGYGTSFAAPIMAGVQALVNAAHGGRAGNPNPVLYSLARRDYHATGNAACNSTKGSAVAKACIFHDITEGNIDVPCVRGTPGCYAPSGVNGVLSAAKAGYKPAFPAGTGWDFATGIGSIDVANLVKKWPK